MTRIGCFLRKSSQFRRVLADFELLGSIRFRDSVKLGNLGLASGPTSHGSVVERQNRYPSPMQGLVRVLNKLLHFFHPERDVEGIAYSAKRAEVLGEFSSGKEVRGWFANSSFVQLPAFWHLPDVVTRFCCRAFTVLARALRVRPLWAVTWKQALRLAQGSISSARISATAADHWLTVSDFNRAIGARRASVAFAFANASGLPAVNRRGR